MKEQKAYAFDGLRTLRTKGDDNNPLGQFSGYASTWTKDLDGDIIAPGAFAQSIADKKGKIPILANHDPHSLVGFSTGLAEDHKGLLLDGQLGLGSSQADDMFAILQTAQSVEYRMGMSIGFIANEVEWDGETRVIKTIDLWEVSFTPFPANPRAFVDDVKTLRTFEKHLRDVGGFSVNDAKRVLALLQRSLPPDGSGGRRPAPLRDVGGTRSNDEVLAHRIAEAKRIWQHP